MAAEEVGNRRGGGLSFPVGTGKDTEEEEALNVSELIAVMGGRNGE